MFFFHILAEHALNTMNFDVIRGRPMRIMWSQRDPASAKTRCWQCVHQELGRKHRHGISIRYVFRLRQCPVVQSKSIDQISP